ncbi:SGNH/GDSL hydrolase family protein [Sphaerisporangium fuscum]|uniref:SGNH/GDSL hydrolase family protein n=1 Tax=Sphaerisporangium fuscum TaxID=2835868 RepID=UPI001BDCE4A0|nr:SGNH/GDSL hydrolase family protein [Sphaerisporangium fuscum]
MMNERHAWPLALGLAPVLAVQGLVVRKRTPRLPEAAGPRRGSVPGSGEPIRLAVLGESTAAGVGVESHEDGMAGHLARALAARTGQPVEWQVAARTGATTRVVIDDLAPLVEPADVLFVALGVNDLLELTRLRLFERHLTELVGAVRERAGKIVLAGMPPVGRFPSLPQPLRSVMGLRARALDHVIAGVAKAEGAWHFSMEIPADLNGFFAADGFHPSGVGYRSWAEAAALRL